MSVTPKILIPFKLSVYKELQESGQNPVVMSGDDVVELIETARESNNYPILTNTGNLYSLNGKPELKDLPVLKIKADRRNPIEGGRLACGMTFAVRVYNFIKSTEVCDAASEDEREGLMNMASELLEWQIATAEDPVEINYLKNVGLWEKD